MISYPAIVHKDKKSGYWLEFIDFDSCMTQGETMEELYMMAQDALSLVLDYRLEENKEIPEPSKTKDRKNVIYVEPYPDVAIPLMVKQIRRAKGLTQEDIAKMLGVSYQTYQKMERGQRVNPTLKTLERLASVFGLQLVLDFKTKDNDVLMNR